MRTARRRPSPWRIALRALLVLPLVALLCLFIGAVAFYPFPFFLVPLPWAVAFTTLLGLLIFVVMYRRASR